MFRTNKVLKSTGWGNPGTVGTASGTNHQEHTTVRTVRSASPVYRIHPATYAKHNSDVFSAWVNHLHSIFAPNPISPRERLRSPLSVGEQLSGPIQLRPLHPFPVLRRRYVQLSRLYDDIPSSGFQ